MIRKHRALASWRHAVPGLFVSFILVSLALIALAVMLGMSTVAATIGAILAAGLAIYFLACCAAAAPFAGSLDLRATLLLPPVICVYQVAYGLGFLIAILKLARRGAGDAQPARFFTALTR